MNLILNVSAKSIIDEIQADTKVVTNQWFSKQFNGIYCEQCHRNFENSMLWTLNVNRIESNNHTKFINFYLHEQFERVSKQF